jgi:hypothetical protein
MSLTGSWVGRNGLLDTGRHRGALHWTRKTNSSLHHELFNDRGGNPCPSKRRRERCRGALFLWGSALVVAAIGQTVVALPLSPPHVSGAGLGYAFADLCPRSGNVPILATKKGELISQIKTSGRYLKMFWYIAPST